MTIRLVRKLTCMQDLVQVEKCIHAMYHTADCDMPGLADDGISMLSQQCHTTTIVQLETRRRSHTHRSCQF
jgi:hypothetical protein